MPLFLAGLLVRGGALTPDVVEEALQRQVISGGALDTSLLELGSIDEPTLAEYLARASGLPPAPAEVLASPDPRLRRLLPLRLAERHGLVPFAQGERTLLMACTYPADAALLDEMGFLLSQRIEAHVAPEFRIRLAIERLYGQPASARMHELGRRWGGPMPETPASPVAPPPAAPVDGEAEAIPDWSVADALARLEASPDRDVAIETVLRFARKAFSYVAVFGVFGGRAVGWDARSTEAGAGKRIEQVSQPLDEETVLGTVLRTGGRYLGPVPDDDANRSLLSRMGRRLPQSAFVQPVIIGERTVALVYADNGEEPVSVARAAETMVVVQALGASLERMIRSRKAAVASVAAPAADAPATAPPAEAPPAPETVVRPAEAGRFDSAPEELPPAPEAAAAPAAVAPAPVESRPAFRRDHASLASASAAVEAILASRTDAERESAGRRLGAAGGAAAEILVALLPGPLRFDGAGGALGGPVIEALASLGPAAVPALARAATSPQAAVRYWAAVLLGSSGDSLARQILGKLSDDADPHVAAVARTAAA